MGTIGWLHISDFHVGKDEYGQRRLFRALLEHTRQKLAGGFRPSFVFTTGDVAQCGQDSQYEEFVGEFLTPLHDELRAAGSEAAFVAVPGNHDVDRTRAPLVSRETVLKRARGFFDPTEEGLSFRKHVMPRFQSFADNDVTAASPHWLTGKSGALTKEYVVDGVRIGVVGLNTAWLSEGPDDRRKLQVGVGIVEDALATVEGSDLVIVLGHHPLAWLDDNDERQLAAAFSRNGALYLHGHMHKTESRILDGAGRLFRTIQAGSAFQSRDDEIWENRILWCTYDHGMRNLSLEPWTWVGSDREWRIDGRGLPEDARLPGAAVWQFPMPHREGSRGAKVAVNHERMVGWRIMSLADIERESVSDEELLRYFDGGQPSIGIAASVRIPRRKIVAETIGAMQGEVAALSGVLVTGAVAKARLRSATSSPWT